MFLLILFIIIIFIILYFIHNKIYKYDNLVKVKSTLDDHYYWVRDKPDKTIAANTLAKIKANTLKLINYLKKNINKFPDYKDSIKNYIRRTKVINIMETPQDEKYTSFTVDKRVIYYCLRSKFDDSIHDMNTLMYVVLHENAHVQSDSIGHTSEFKKNFKFLLERGIEIGIYEPIDYRIHQQFYCGMTINEFLL